MVGYIDPTDLAKPFLLDLEDVDNATTTAIRNLAIFEVDNPLLGCSGNDNFDTFGQTHDEKQLCSFETWGFIIPRSVVCEVKQLGGGDISRSQSTLSKLKTQLA